MSNSNFPTSLDTWTNPSGSDQESSSPVPHHLQHGTANDALAAIETKLGVDNSAVTTTIDYLVKTSANPGHTHTNPISVNSITLTGTNKPSGGPGAWTDGTNLFLTTASSAGGIVIRPNGPTSTSHQFSVSSTGVVATTSAVGSIANTLDDGSGNLNISGNATVVGSLIVEGAFSTGSFIYGIPSNSLVTDSASQGVATSLARSDHIHGREGFSASLPLPDGTANAGISPHPARADHVHALQGEITGVIKMWSTATAPSGYVLCDGSSYPTTGALANLFSVIQYTYGGSGSNFNVPDFRSVSPIGVGTGTHTGTTTRTLAGFYGAETVTLTQGQLPTSIGTAAAQTVTDPGHGHGYTEGNGGNGHQHGLTNGTNYNRGPNINLIGVSDGNFTPGITSVGGAYGSYAAIGYATTGITISNGQAANGQPLTSSSSAVTNSSGGNSTPIVGPTLGIQFIIKT